MFKDRILTWLNNYKTKTNCRGVVLGISGGKDSTVCAMLAKKIWGNNMLGIIMPNGIQKDIDDAIQVCKVLNIQYKIVNIEKAYNEIIKAKDDNIIIKIKEFKLKERKIECLMSEDFPTELTDIIELYNLKSYKWLVAFLKNKNNKESYFGEITKNIHEVFVKDPRPFRKDIKQHLVDLLDCIRRLKIKEIEITRPNYSECIKYVG